jgi:hypothetical protein
MFDVAPRPADKVRLPSATMTAALWIGVAAFVTGLVLRLWAWRPYVDLYAKRHAAAPPRGWLWTPSDEPGIERRRRIAALGTVLLWAGAIVAVLNPSM